MCVQKKKRKREKAQDTGGETSNHFPNEQRGDAITEGIFVDFLIKSQSSDIKQC